MSTPALHQQSVPTPSRGADVPPEQRGQLEVSDSAVERLARGAAAEISGVIDEPERGLGRAGRSIDARADVDGQVARVRVDVVLSYPAAVPRVCDQIRTRVIKRLHEYAQISVTRCDIQVTELRAARQERRVR